MPDSLEIRLTLLRMWYVRPFRGRWITADPIGFEGGDVDFYRFVRNNPTDLLDPNGLSPIHGVEDVHYKKIELATKGNMPLEQLKREVPRDQLDRAIKFYDDIGKGNGKVVDKNNALKFNQARAELLKGNGPAPGNITLFNRDLLRSARIFRIARWTGAGGLAIGLFELAMDSQVYPPTDLGVPEDATLVKSTTTLAGEQQTWRTTDGREIHVDILPDHFKKTTKI